MPRFESENSWSLGQLFAGFMQHYDRNFDFTADVASVRTGRILPMQALVAGNCASFVNASIRLCIVILWLLYTYLLLSCHNYS